MATVALRLTGRICEPIMTMPVSATILDLKHKISGDFNVDVGKQILSCGYGDQKEILEDSRTIESYSHHYKDDIVEVFLHHVTADFQRVNIMVKYGSQLRSMLTVSEGDGVALLKYMIEERLLNWGLDHRQINLTIHNTKMIEYFNLRQYYIGDGSVILVEKKEEDQDHRK